jgi:hypothetical protein
MDTRLKYSSTWSYCIVCISIPEIVCFIVIFVQITCNIVAYCWICRLRMDKNRCPCFDLGSAYGFVCKNVEDLLKFARFSCGNAIHRNPRSPALYCDILPRSQAVANLQFMQATFSTLIALAWNKTWHCVYGIQGICPGRYVTAHAKAV